MSTNVTLEERVSALEAEVSDLRRQAAPKSRSWLDKFDGLFAEEPAYEEVVQYGNQWRRSDAEQKDSTC
jgi:hypothetical protein